MARSVVWRGCLTTPSWCQLEWMAQSMNGASKTSSAPKKMSSRCGLRRFDFKQVIV